MFTEGTLAEIRQRLSIVEVISEYVPLKKAGQGFIGLCPFHKEKTPSFHVHPLKQCFHCFGCHKGGNVFTFICEIEGLSFPDTVIRLAKRTGVTIEETRKSQKPQAAVANQTRLIAAQDWAAKYFHYLLSETKEHRYAKDYVLSRGLNEATLKRFRIGVAPKGWNTLLKLLLKRGFKIDELIQCGLVVPKEGSPDGGYDRFRQRLMFPITDIDGNTIGFGARLLLQEENQPKYINSPESPLFSKRKVLYGLAENQRGIRVRGEAILVEGYMDVVTLCQCGVDNAIATMGTAVTEEHCRQLKPLTRRVVTLFDADAAGNEAWQRSVHLFLESGFYAKDLSLPPGKDPDDYVLEHGADKIYSLCEKAPRQITKLLKDIATRGAVSEEETARLLETFTPILLASRRLSDRATLWDDISLVLKISVATLKEFVETAAKKMSGQITLPTPTKKTAPVSPGKSLLPVEKEFLHAVLRTPERFINGSSEWKGGIRDPRILKWLESLKETTDLADFENRAQALLLQESHSELLGVVSSALVRNDAAQSKEDLAQFDAVSARIRERKKEADIKALSLQVRLSGRMGDAGAEIRLLEQLKDLRTQ